MQHFHLLFKFLNKIKSKYVEERSVEREGELGRGRPPRVALLGSHQGCDYSEKENISCLMLGSCYSLAPRPRFGEGIKWSPPKPVFAGDWSQNTICLTLIYISRHLLSSVNFHKVKIDEQFKET